LFTVSELTSNIKKILETKFKFIEVEGEISGPFKPHYSGHYYFTLKDKDASIDAIIWKSTAGRLNLNLREGDSVIVKGGVTLYEKYGKYQIIVNNIRKKGIGDLFAEFQKLKLKLEKEGLFDFERKPLPKVPRKVAVITAKDAAALGDFIKVAKKRYPFLNLVIVPTPVQGINASVKIAENIKFARKIKDVDLIVVTRGGGSLQELWPFNEEVTARAIYECKIPVVTAIGHERDYTIADFVADKRASTPSNAAEIIYPDYSELKEKLAMIKSKILYILFNKIENSWLILSNEKQKLLNKAFFVGKHKEKLRDLKVVLINKTNSIIAEKREDLIIYKEFIKNNDPQRKLLQRKHEIAVIKNRLKNEIREKMNREKNSLEIIKSKINLLSPYTFLDKGYVLIKKENNTVTSVSSLKKHDKLRIFFKDGEVIAEVKEIIGEF